MRKKIATLAATLLAAGLMGAPAAAKSAGAGDHWGPMGPHPHALLLHATLVPNDSGVGPPFVPVAWERCVDLAGGKALPKSNHHTGIHTGTAGMKLRDNAGHLVVPYDCATLESFFDEG
jgi:hypothetical protein